jgi:hypothetical protein
MIEDMWFILGSDAMSDRRKDFVLNLLPVIALLSIRLPDEKRENQNAEAQAANAFLTLYNSPDHE